MVSDMPRRNNRDKRFEPREYDNNRGSNFDSSTDAKKPKRKRKDKYDKSIYRETE